MRNVKAGVGETLNYGIYVINFWQKAQNPSTALSEL